MLERSGAFKLLPWGHYKCGAPAQLKSWGGGDSAAAPGSSDGWDAARSPSRASCDEGGPTLLSVREPGSSRREEVREEREGGPQPSPRFNPPAGMKAAFLSASGDTQAAMGANTCLL